MYIETNYDPEDGPILHIIAESKDDLKVLAYLENLSGYDEYNVLPEPSHNINGHIDYGWLAYGLSDVFPNPEDEE